MAVEGTGGRRSGQVDGWVEGIMGMKERDESGIVGWEPKVSEAVVVGGTVYW